ncbi:MAG: 5'/3'-nucleotidase SurE [Dehalococcoidales bacterium]|nr:5'/3'-nucleotidase SurE [Dehalococcoidales bacterium]
MEILVTNDDGVFAPGLWTVVKELTQIARVIVVAPDREQSAQGTAVTLRQPLRVRQATPLVLNVTTYAVEGTPADSIILALGKLVKCQIDMVVSGINSGPNLGDDVFISGTVGAALQSYLRGIPSLAISVTSTHNQHLEDAARLARLIAGKVNDHSLPGNIFLNVNLPNLPLARINDAKITKLASQTHIDTVAEGNDGRQAYYWLVREKITKTAAKDTDIGAIEHDNISITPLHHELLNHPSPVIIDRLGAELLGELREMP